MRRFAFGFNRVNKIKCPSMTAFSEGRGWTNFYDEIAKDAEGKRAGTISEQKAAKYWREAYEKAVHFPPNRGLTPKWKAIFNKEHREVAEKLGWKI